MEGYAGLSQIAAHARLESRGRPVSMKTRRERIPVTVNAAKISTVTGSATWAPADCYKKTKVASVAAQASSKCDLRLKYIHLG